MKYLSLALIVFFYSCTKQTAIKDLEGTYDVQGYKVRCNYFGCDSVEINSVLNLQFEDENTKVRAKLFNNSLGKNEGVGILDLKKIDKDFITLESNTFYAKFDRKNKTIKYVDANNWNKYVLTDTASNYYYLKGVKQ